MQDLNAPGHEALGWRKSTMEMFSLAVSLSMSYFGVMRAIRSRRRLIAQLREKRRQGDGQLFTGSAHYLDVRVDPAWLTYL
jgi:hypothetical protein